MDLAITLTDFFFMAVVAATPLLFATLGAILTEKSGSLNLGVEGMMMMGAAVGLSASYLYEAVVGDAVVGIFAALLAILFGFIAGALGALIFSVLTVTFRANQNVTGLALTIFGIGTANLIGELLSTHAGGRTYSSEATLNVFSDIGIPLLRDIPIIGRLFFSYNFMVYFAIVVAIALMWFFNKTRVGLNLRAVGENPATADAVGINVTRYKFLATCIGGGICGVGGMYIAMVDFRGVWDINIVAGRGWIAIALVIFAAWRPVRAIIGALLFGALSVLWLYFPAIVEALGINIDIRAIPAQVYNVLPFIATILVLVITSIRQSKDHSQPKSCGINYFREER